MMKIMALAVENKEFLHQEVLEENIRLMERQILDYVFFLFFVVNVYDLFIMDIGIFMHCKKFWIPGTEDMIQEYHNPRHHIVGAGKGTIIGLLVAFLAAVLIQIIHIIPIG